MLKKKAKDKRKLQETLQNYAKKIKDLEKQLQHVPTTATKQSKASRTTKRDSAYFSSSREKGLQKPPKKPRVIKKYHWFIYHVLHVITFKNVMYIIISTIY